MSELISVQTEFEKLISELEKLKSLNEFASANTASAQSVINGVDEFVKTSKSLQSQIEEQQAQELVRLTKAIEELSKLSTDLVTTKDSLVSENSDLLKQHNEVLENKIKSLTESVNQRTQDLSQKIQLSERQLLDKVEDSFKTSSEQLSGIEGSIVSSMENMKSAFTQVQIKQSKQIKLLIVFSVFASIAAMSLTLWLLLIRYGII